MKTKIKVAVRVRPFLENEKKQGFKNTKLIINKDKNEITIQNENLQVKNYKFDHILDQLASQKDVYNDCNIDQYINKALEGYHSTIFAYGQTGSGKTHTMEGFEDFQNNKNRNNINNENQQFEDPQLPENENQNYGLIPQIVFQLFEKCKAQQNRHFNIFCSFLQIYNEKIYDLLNPSFYKFGNNNSLINPNSTEGFSQQGGLRLRWTSSDQFTVENLFVFECQTPEEVIHYFQQGVKNRIKASHKLNLQSSRSHTILTLRIESYDKASENHLSSKLELVDLAGSERIGQTGTEGKQAKESIEINRSLFILRQVISSLAEIGKNPKNREQQTHIPYRESKLTSLLKQSIGGNSYCLMLACLQPSDLYLEENISTLTYANKATYIQCQPIQNDDPKIHQIQELKEEIKNLKNELEKANKHIQLLTQITDQQKQKLINIKNSQNQAEEINDINGSIIQQNAQNQQQKLNIPATQIQLQIQNQNIQDPNSFNSNSNNNNIDYDHFSDRLIESISMVRELLYSNKELRELTDEAKKQADFCQQELVSLQRENQELREKLNQPLQNFQYSAYGNTFDITQERYFNSNILQDPENINYNNLIQNQFSDSEYLQNQRKTSPFQQISYDDNKFKQMSKNELITHILQIRREKKILERQVKSLNDIDKQVKSNTANTKIINNQIKNFNDISPSFHNTPQSNNKINISQNGLDPLSTKNYSLQNCKPNLQEGENQNIDYSGVRVNLQNLNNMQDNIQTRFGRNTFYQNSTTNNNTQIQFNNSILNNFQNVSQQSDNNNNNIDPINFNNSIQQIKTSTPKTFMVKSFYNTGAGGNSTNSQNNGKQQQNIINVNQKIQKQRHISNDFNYFQQLNHNNNKTMLNKKSSFQDQYGDEDILKGQVTKYSALKNNYHHHLNLINKNSNTQIINSAKKQQIHSKKYLNSQNQNNSFSYNDNQHLHNNKDLL